MEPQDARDAVAKQVELILEGSLGLDIFSMGPESKKPPGTLWIAAFWGFLYAFLFCIAPLIVAAIFHLQLCRPLLVLQIYGSFWCGWCTATSRWTSALVLKTLERDVIPQLSAKAAADLQARLAVRYDRKRQLIVTWCLAPVFAALAGWLVSRDLYGDWSPSNGELAWWSFGWLFLFAAAAKVVNTATFYRLFATSLEDDPGGIYALDPANSAIVKSISAVGRTMLVFWSGIAFSIILVIPFGVGASFDIKAGGPHFLAFDWSRNSFALVDIFVVGSFSVGLGSVIFLLTEAALRRAVRNAVLSKLRSIEAQAASLTAQLGGPGTIDLGHLKELNQLHRDIAGADAYRNPILSGLSLVIPFIPLLSLLFQLL